MLFEEGRIKCNLGSGEKYLKPNPFWRLWNHPIRPGGLFCFADWREVRRKKLFSWVSFDIRSCLLVFDLKSCLDFLWFFPFRNRPSERLEKVKKVEARFKVKKRAGKIWSQKRQENKSHPKWESPSPTHYLFLTVWISLYTHISREVGLRISTQPVVASSVA